MNARPAVQAVLAAALLVGGLPASATAALKPVAGKSVVVEAQGGTVTVKAKGAGKAARLRGARLVPLGATIDATKGKAGLLASGRAKARVSGGSFVVGQQGAVVTLTLTGGPVRCVRGGTPGTAIRRLRLEGSGRFKLVGCYASATTKAGGARASAFQITVDASGFVIVMEDGPNGTSVEVVRGTAVQVIDYLRQHPEVLAQGGTITFTASGTVFTRPATPTPTPPGPARPSPPAATGSCANGLTDSPTDAVQDPTGPITPLPDLLCASVVRDGSNIVVTAQASNPIPDANRPEARFYTGSGLPASFPGYGYGDGPCSGWLDMRQLPGGFHGLGVYDCATGQTVLAPATYAVQASNTYVSTFAAAPAGLSGPFSWRIVLEGTCNTIDAVPDRSALPASAAC